jgi:hypothetical protein
MRVILFTLAAAVALAARPVASADFNAPPPTRAQIEADWLRQDAKRLAPSTASAQVSREADAAGAVDGVKDGKWGFHTENEKDPWWQVDLGKLVELGRVVIYNRCDGGYAARNARLRVWLSDNGREFWQVYEHDGTVFRGFTDGKPLALDFQGVPARFVRLGLRDASYFHLDEVEINPAGGTNNLALGKPATQSSTSQWSADHGQPAARKAGEYPVALVVQRGLQLAKSQERLGQHVEAQVAVLQEVAEAFKELPAEASEEAKRALYLRAHWATREMALANPLLNFDSILFVKRAPTLFPHISDQHYGWWSRGGGGIYVLRNFKQVGGVKSDRRTRPESRPAASSPLTPALPMNRSATVPKASRSAGQAAAAGLRHSRAPVLGFKARTWARGILSPLRGEGARGEVSLAGEHAAATGRTSQSVVAVLHRQPDASVWPENPIGSHSPFNEERAGVRGESAWRLPFAETPSPLPHLTQPSPLPPGAQREGSGSSAVHSVAQTIPGHDAPSPSPLNGERAGVRGEAVQTSVRLSKSPAGNHPSDRSAPEVVCLTADLPPGNFIGPDISYDGRKVLFAYARFYPELHTEKNKANKVNVPEDAFYHVFEMNVDGTGRRQLTRGRYDDFEARYLPNGDILFLSTRKGLALQASASFSDSTRSADLPDSYVRCGGDNWRPVPVFTMHAMDAEGRNLRPLSAFENFEWAPSVASDGRILYTRWDYIDRFNGHFFSLWSANQDGTNPQLVYGNYTVKPQVVLEARSIPGSSKLVFTACAHHSITGGALCLLDRTRGIEEQAPLTRLTPEVCFPETEGWPEHYYAHPWPLSEEYFLVGWADAKLPPHRFVDDHHNPTNAMGIYLYDALGNLELLYRDPEISSVTPLPVAPRSKPPAQAPLAEWSGKQEGRFLVQDIYRGLAGVRRGSVKQLRIVGMPPKVQPHMNNPVLGVSAEDPGKFVLGTVPVEADGSAHFRVPSGVPVFFQALDEQGLAVQTMRSLSYVMPGQTLACIGCHEHQDNAPPAGKAALAALREPSKLTPGPSGSWPLRFDELVQPVLDRQCVSCHRPGSADHEAAKLDLTATHAWKALMTFGGEDLKKLAFERDRSIVGQGVAANSKLWKLLADPSGHKEVKLDPASLARLATWMDTYAHRVGHYSEAQARELADLRTRLADLLQSRPDSR